MDYSKPMGGEACVYLAIIFIMQKSWEKGVGMYNVTRHGVKIEKADLHVNYLRV